MNLFNARWKRWTVVLVTLAVLAPAGYWGTKRLVWPKVRAWRSERMNKEARDFLAAGDDANALLTARKILAASTNNVEAWRIATTAARNRKIPDVVYYQKNLAGLEPTKANYLELMRLSLEYGSLGTVLEAINAIGQKASDDPEFHALAAKFYRRTNQLVPAKYALLALTQLRPSDREAQLDLAELEMAEDPERKDRQLRPKVRDLASDPKFRVRALTMLLRESIKARLPAETTELVTRLQAIPDLSVSDRLLLMEGATLMTTPALSQVEKLQTEVAGNPRDVVRVMDFLARTGQHEKVLGWFGTLSEEVKRDENVRREAAESMLALGKWADLEAHLKAALWPNGEYLRHTLLAYSYRARGRAVDFGNSWKTAVDAVGTDLPKIRDLLQRTEQWKWPEERYDVIWKLFAVLPTNTTVQQALIVAEKRAGRTGNLNKIFSRIVDVEPGDALAKNNFAYTSLLLDANVTRANSIIQQLVQTMPKNPFIVTTYAFSLFKQQKYDEALAKLETLTPTELSIPDRVLLRAVFLAHTGQSDRALEMLRGIDLKPFLPEEQQLAQKALALISQKARTQEDVARLNATRTTAGDAKGWLAVVTADTRELASVDMQLTDPLYASGDWPGLQAAVRRADWKTENYLKFALLAYAQRSAGDTVQSRDSWRQALQATERSAARAENLKLLTAKWNWPAERIEALNIVFDRNRGDRAMLTELTKYYRETKRTQELLRVLNWYVSPALETSDEAVALAYYSLISDQNLNRAQVLAKAAFDSAPDNPTRRLVYAFSLWKNRRGPEAMNLLSGLRSAGDSEPASAPLVRAAIEADLGQAEDARNNLALFSRENALPEEVALADKIALQLARQAAPAKK
jgi:cytochrome c-type biogenesis protein CcmH/NrfG